MSDTIFSVIIVYGKKIIVFFIQGINGIQKTCQMIVDASAPYKSVAVGVGFYLCPVNKQFLQRDKTCFFQKVQELVVQVVKDFRSKFVSLKLLESIPLWLCSL